MPIQTAVKTIILTQVHCTSMGETGKHGDDIYLRYKSESMRDFTRYPAQGVGYSDMKQDDNWELSLKLDFSEQIEIQLYDNDSTSKNDFLGSHVYYPEDTQPATIEIHAGDNKGRYQFKTIDG